MNRFVNKTKILEGMDIINFNEENFETRANIDGLKEFTDEKLFKYAKDYKDEIEDAKVVDKKRTLKHGIFETIYGVRFLVPKIVTTNDEIKYIELLTKMINYKTHQDSVNYGITTDVIPTFNIYDYLARYHSRLDQLYLLYKKNEAIKCAQTNDIEAKRKLLPLIYSYLVLEERKDNYNIDELNRINSKVDNQEKALIFKNYTL